MSKVLLIDDDETLLKLLDISLKHHGFEVRSSCKGHEGIRLAYREQPDVVIADVRMPEMNGIELCRRLRQMTDASIIMLSGLNDECTVLDALEAGADDYVTKPYHLGELVARIHAKLRSRDYTGTAREKDILTVGEVSIEVDRRRVMVRGEEVALTPTEYTLLFCLARSPNKVVGHRELLTEGWGPEFVDQLEYLRLYMRYLRQKIEENPRYPQILKTARGVGYYIAG